MGKSFKDQLTADSPAAAYLTTEEPRKLGDWTHREPHQIGAEAKSRRVNLLMRPSTHEAAKERASSEGLSFNEYVHRLIEADLREGR